MCETSLSVWFVCRLCRGSFGQVDAFIEHKKQKHFNEFQNTTSIVFEESEQCLLFPVENIEDHHLADVSNERPIKIEVNDEDPINPFNWEIIDEPNLDLLQPKSELITYESELNPVREDNFFCLEQPRQNPYVLLKRLTSEEIQSACVPKNDSTLLKYKQKNFANYGSELRNRNSAGAGGSISDQSKVGKSTENPSIPPVIHFSKKPDLQFECKLCSKQLKSDAQLKVHVRSCALDHEDGHRFCVVCNRMYYNGYILKCHRLRYHGTEEEMLSLFKFKCHICPNQYRYARALRFHMESHQEKNQQVNISNSESLN